MYNLLMLIEEWFEKSYFVFKYQCLHTSDCSVGRAEDCEAINTLKSLGQWFKSLRGIFL